MPYLQQQQQPMQGTQGQLICGGCRTLLVYPQGASNVRCALCSSVTTVPSPGTEMAQLVCAGCRTLLMYMRGATSVQCSCCHTVNLAMETVVAAVAAVAPPPPPVAHVYCGGCSMTLMYAYGAQSVKCALCQYVTSIAMPPPNMQRMPLPMQQQQQRPSAPPQLLPPPLPPVPAAAASAHSHMQTVVVENPMTLDESDKLVSNVAVGVTTDTN